MVYLLQQYGTGSRIASAPGQLQKGHDLWRPSNKVYPTPYQGRVSHCFTVVEIIRASSWCLQPQLTTTQEQMQWKKTVFALEEGLNCVIPQATGKTERNVFGSQPSGTAGLWSPWDTFSTLTYTNTCNGSIQNKAGATKPVG